MSCRLRSRNRKMSHKGVKPVPISQWRRSLIWIGSIVTALVAAIATALGTGVGHGLYAAFTARTVSPESSSTPKLGSLSLTQSHGSYRFIIPISNSRSAGQQVRQISIAISWSDSNGCWNLVEPVYSYVVSSELRLLPKHKVVGQVTPKVGIAAGSSARAVGNLSLGCHAELNLSFRPPAMMLADQTTSLVSVALPANMSGTATDRSSSEVAIPDFTATSHYPIGVQLTVQLSSGTQISRCEISLTSTC